MGTSSRAFAPFTAACLLACLALATGCVGTVSQTNDPDAATTPDGSSAHDAARDGAPSTDARPASDSGPATPDAASDSAAADDAPAACTPACGDHNCGDDGCGGSCGACPADQTCNNGHCEVPCGSNGHPCCADRACNDGSLCTDTGFGPICLCGHNGQACCPGRSCSDGSLCTDTGFGPLCLCGNNGQVCCPGRTCNDGSLCTDTGFGPLCLCGHAGQACCPGRSCSDGSSCTDTGFGPLCTNDTPSCDALQWWNSALTYEHVVSGWNDTDLAVVSGTPVQLRHRSVLNNFGVYDWGYMPEFTDSVTGAQFKLLHLRPAFQWATEIGREYPAGFIVGLSGGDTPETGLGVYSTGAHLCVQTFIPYRDAFPAGEDACHSG